MRRLVVLAAVHVALAAMASAQPADPAPAPEPTPPVSEPTPPSQDAALSTFERRLQVLADENQELRDELTMLREDHEYLEQQQAKVAPITGKLTGYLDVGFFSVAGDGTGIRLDTGNEVFPEYDYVSGGWVFLGDPLSTMINSRGDPATTGDSRAITLDPIRGRTSSFLVNSLNVGLFAEVGKNLVFTSKLDVLPRGRDVADIDGLFLGDYVDLRLAYAEYRIRRDKVKVELSAGKFDSVVGFEYRSQEAPTRIEVTPSLICRYTCGYPVGLKARFRFLEDLVVVNTAVTNGSQFSEGFGFYNESDTNDSKTVSGRLSVQIPGIRELELGVSGAVGAQDNQESDDVRQSMYAVDVHLHRHDLVVRGEFVQGWVKGETEPGRRPCAEAPCLSFKGAYGLVGYRITNIVMPFVRVDWRDALHRNGTSFVYVSELIRGTAGIRLTVNENLIVKAEYTLNRELGRIPSFPNDVFTSSVVVKY